MTFEEFVNNAEWYYRNHQHEYRHGQAVYNYLATVRPDVASQVVGTPSDPYYAKHIPHSFWELVSQAWAVE